MARIKDVLQQIAWILKQYSDTRHLDARILLSHFTGKSQEFLLSNPDYAISDLKKLWHLVERRKNYEPIAYIIGSKEFYGRSFIVDKNVLIPRPDSEIMIEAIVQRLQYKKNLNILELGCGSGCLIISLIKELSGAIAIACDISGKALTIAKQNAKLHNVDNKIAFIESDWYQQIPQMQFDIIISNPPYISSHEKNLVAIETLKYEPHQSLFDEDLQSYNIIASSASIYLKPTGKMFLEIGIRQEQPVANIMLHQGLQLNKTYPDLAGIIRILELAKN